MSVSLCFSSNISFDYSVAQMLCAAKLKTHPKPQTHKGLQQFSNYDTIKKSHLEKLLNTNRPAKILEAGFPFTKLWFLHAGLWTLIALITLQPLR